MKMLSNVILKTHPDLPHHLRQTAGLTYLADPNVETEPLPERFHALPSPVVGLGPPESTVVFGLETGRFQMRERFIQACWAMHPTDHDALGWTMQMVSACFFDLYGSRGPTPDMVGFDAWLRAQIANAPTPELGQHLRKAWDEGGPQLSPPDLEEPIEQIMEALDEEGSTAAWALGRLALLDWERAAQYARHAHEDGTHELDDDAWGRCVQQLCRYSSPDALERELDAWGITSVPGYPPTLLKRMSAVGYGDPLCVALERRGRVLVVDSETGHVPPNHADLLYWLSALTPELGDVHFDQYDPWSDDEDLEPDFGAPIMTLQAWHEGRAYRTPACYHGDFYDISSALGLINTVLQDAECSYRIAHCDPPDQVCMVVAVPMDALEHAHQLGVLAYGGRG
ncbi:MAG: hypothetical protein AAFX99_20945 [Myxococcota bacterium]